MLADHRQEQIMQLLGQRGSLTLRDIVLEFDVSDATARRDATHLASAGRLTRVYGGIVAKGLGELPFAVSDTTDRAEKYAIARAAAAMVNDGDTVILDIGSTVLELARVLGGRPITVITGNLMIYEALREHPSTELVLLGGYVRRNYWATTGHIAARVMESMHADISFLGASGITARGSVLDSTSDDVPVKQQTLASADRSVLLATERKFPGNGQHVVCHVSQLEAIITSERTPDSAVSQLAVHGVDIVRASASDARRQR